MPRNNIESTPSPPKIGGFAVPGGPHAPYRLAAQWIWASTAGWFLGYAMGFAVVAGIEFSYRPIAETVFGAVVGAGFGLTQYWVLRRRFRYAYWWPITCILGWTLGVFAGELATDRWLGNDVNFIAERILLGAVIGLITGAMQWMVVRRSYPQEIWWLGVSIPGYLVALVVHGLLIFAVGNGLVKSLAGAADIVMNSLPLALLPFGFGLAAAVMAWFLLRRRLDNALIWVSIGLVGFWAWWVLLQAGSGPRDMGTSAAVALMAALIGATVGITTGACLAWLTRQTPAEVG
ncbi:MAG: hypothetical protein BZY88_13900 [SAR202 cluster bacterium Io17-Chloro-G9]|nr:MAG: hypothetical protein BZY88_13900 [SAR202 cluster bacterium Io17-Chloro-G9]